MTPSERVAAWRKKNPAKLKAQREKAKGYGAAYYAEHKEEILALRAKERRAAGANPQHKLSGSPIYKLWQGIKERCLNSKCKFYDRYGGRGIRIAHEWINAPGDFIAYVLQKLGPRPSKRYSIDRIENNGHYEPGNIRWATFEEQNRNRRTSKLTRDDVVQIKRWLLNGRSAADVSRVLGVDPSHVSRIANGKAWSEGPSKRYASRFKTL